jgi:hypothetical protein
MPFLAAFLPNFCHEFCTERASSDLAFCDAIHFSPFFFFFSFSRSVRSLWLRFCATGVGIGADGSWGRSDERGTFVDPV